MLHLLETSPLPQQDSPVIHDIASMSLEDPEDTLPLPATMLTPRLGILSRPMTPYPTPQQMEAGQFPFPTDHRVQAASPALSSLSICQASSLFAAEPHRLTLAGLGLGISDDMSRGSSSNSSSSSDTVKPSSHPVMFRSVRFAVDRSEVEREARGRYNRHPTPFPHDMVSRLLSHLETKSRPIRGQKVQAGYFDFDFSSELPAHTRNSSSTFLQAVLDSSQMWK